jgi:hypothetical protein
LLACYRRHKEREGTNELKVVVRGDSVMALNAAAEAAMDDDVLALGAREGRDRRHRGSARARAVPT